MLILYPEAFRLEKADRSNKSDDEIEEYDGWLGIVEDLDNLQELS